MYGGSGIRTHDLHLAKVPLYQLSYTPFKFSKAESYCSAIPCSPALATYKQECALFILIREHIL